jgi:hypothetical protein
MGENVAWFFRDPGLPPSQAVPGLLPISDSLNPT